MRALLIKDTYTMLKQMKLFFLLLLILAIVPSFSSVGFAIVYAALLPITAIAYDERAKWDKLAVMMPFSPTDMVVSKYLLGYIFIAAALVFCFAVQFVVSIFSEKTVFGPTLLPELLAVVAVALLLMSINLPLVFKLGVEKGRMMFMVITVAIVIAGVTYFDKYFSNMESAGMNVTRVSLTLLLISAAVSVLSMLFSINVYKQKEQ